MRAAVGASRPMSAWLPITRASVMCVMSVSPSARQSELLIEYRKSYLKLRFGGAWVPDRRAEPAVVHGFARGLLVLDLPDQLALRITQSAGDVRVLGDPYQPLKAGAVESLRLVQEPQGNAGETIQ